jgi:Family of unknown function (DUF5764)
MDDFVLSNLHESRNEWCSRLVTVFTPLVMEGLKSIFDSAWKMCVDADEVGKYLMTFQNLLSQIPKWNSVIVEKERQRIIERSGCNYLEDLITCVHIIQLKVLTAVRVGNRQKKIDISIPKLDHFIHRVYIACARKVYTNVYLFEKNISPLQMQKNTRELEIIVQECIMTTIRESIPTEDIIRAYLEEDYEHEEEVIIEPIPEKGAAATEDGDAGGGGGGDGQQSSIAPTDTAANSNSNSTDGDKDKDNKEYTPPTLGVTPLSETEEPAVTTKLSFHDIDAVLESDNQIGSLEAPKTVERLEAISAANAMQRKLDEEDDGDDDDEKLNFGEEISLELDGFDSVGGSGAGGAGTQEPSIINLDIEDIV